MRNFYYDNNPNWKQIFIQAGDQVMYAYARNTIVVTSPSIATSTPSTLRIVFENYEIALPFARPTTFNLEWIKYFAPTEKSKSITIQVYADDTRVATIPYILIAGRKEVMSKDYYIQHTHFIQQVWQDVEFFSEKPKEVEGWHTYAGDTLHGVNSATLDRPTIGGWFDGETLSIVDAFTPKEVTCYDIAIRMMSRYGTRGVMGGKAIDTSEGGDNVKSRFTKSTIYQGINSHYKEGQKIQKEVFFDCEGDTNLLDLLRDACVYGLAEWYDENTAKWLPCQVVDNSLDTTDAFKEQSITFILQEL